MPIYEYRCTACERTVEAIQKFDDPPLTKCEVCSGRLERLVSRTAFHLKGGGWFQENYSKASSPGSDSPSEGKGKSDDSGGKSGGTPSAGGCGSGSCGCKN